MHRIHVDSVNNRIGEQYGQHPTESAGEQMHCFLLDICRTLFWQIALEENL